MSQTTTEIFPAPVIELSRLDDGPPIPLPSDPPEEQSEVDGYAGSNHSAAEDESQYPTGRKRAVMLAAIGLVLIMDALDSNIVAVAIPALTQHWHSIRDVGWYSAVFRLCTCSFQFMFGKLYKLFNVKVVFLVSIALFIAGSTVCATAPTSIAFIVGRAICGFANAGIIAGAFTVVRLALPLRKRPLWASILAAIEGCATIGSPLLGGVLVENLGWRWCFWINLPTGVLTWIVIALTVSDLGHRESLSTKAKLKELDLPGTLLFFPAMTSLFMALTWAGTKMSWNSPVIIALLCVFVVLLAVFAAEQWLRQDSATLPPRLFKNRSVMAGALFSLSCNGAVTVFEYYLPTYLQAVKSYGPAKSGYLLIPLIVSFLLSLLLQGSGVNVVGYYVPFMWATSIMLPIASGLMTTLSVSTTLAKFFGCSAFLGFATGIGFQAPQVAVQNTLPEKDTHMGLAIILFAQHFGPALSVAVTQTIFTNRLSENIVHFASALDASKVESSGLDDLKSHIGGAQLQGVLLALNKSLVQSWYLPVALACVTTIGSAFMKWTNVKQKRR